MPPENIQHGVADTANSTDPLLKILEPVTFTVEVPPLTTSAPIIDRLLLEANVPPAKLSVVPAGTGTIAGLHPPAGQAECA